jgi:hypothetical protein
VRIAGAAILAVLAPSTPALTEYEQSVQRVASLRTARATHTATTLASGQVLIAGGMADGGGSLSSVELFDPAANAIHALGDLSTPRQGHTATLLRDGRVLIAGGYNGQYLATVEVFDPSTKRFSSAGALSAERSEHTATLLPDGRVLIIGGVGRGWTFLSSAELYDPTTGRSDTVGSMETPRESHTATLLADGRVLVIGGHTGRRSNMEVHSSAEIFSPVSRRFSGAGTLVTARHKHDAVKLADGRVLVIGGADRTDRNYYASTEIYDHRKATFERGPSMVNSRYKIAGTSVVLANGNVLVTAGARAAELLDVASWRFSEVPGRFPDGYHFAASAPLPGGDVFVAGGYSDGNKSTAGVWRIR